MNEQIMQIAARVKELRKILMITPEVAAQTCGLTPDEYLKLESGKVDISVGILHRLAKAFDVEVTTFMNGEEPRMHSYTLTRKGQGVVMERRQAYHYQALAGNYIRRKADPFIVRVEPKQEDMEVDFNSHPGEEFNLVLKGRLRFYLNKNAMVLNEGDSIYFDSIVPHAMQADGEETCEFLAIIL
jgi:transcriptional regulator with XRE-family HTH domain